MLKKIVTIIIFILFLFVITSCNFYDQTEKKDPSTFDELTSSFLVSMIGSDELTCNYYFMNRENYGLENYEPSLYIPRISSMIGVAFTNLYYGRIAMYDYDALSEDQKITYDIISDLLDYINAKTPEMGYLDNNYLGTYLGYQAQLPILLAEYNFRNQTDVENYLKYLALVPETFAGYFEFEEEKADHGYGMPDYVIDNVIEQADKMTASLNDGSCFMYSVVEEKINSSTFLSEEDKEFYIAQNEELLSTSFKEGYEYLSLNLPSLKGRATNELGLAHYVTDDGVEIGKAYYQIIFDRAVGYNISLDEAISYIDEKIVYYKDLLDSLKEALTDDERDLINAILSDEVFLMDNSPSDQLEYYKTAILEYFPSLDVDYTINIKYVDESMADNFSPAAYMTSAIDQTSEETIYLNPASIYLDEEKTILDANYLYTTLAHEGIPGHLYQNVYFKSMNVNPLRKILKCSGVVEGWATYVENFSYNFLRGTYSDNVVDYLIARECLNAAIYSRIDLGIHAGGWDADALYEFMKDWFKVTCPEDVIPALHQLCEIPTNYQKYFFTYLKFMDLYEEVKEALGSEFDPVSYHKVILDMGSCPMRLIEAKIKDVYNLEGDN